MRYVGFGLCVDSPFALPGMLERADEDLPRENDEKTSAVHFLRFELTPSMVEGMKSGATLSVGVDHDYYRHSVSPLPESYRASLCADLD